MLLTTLLLAAHAETPPGWVLAGSDPTAYVAEIDAAVSHDSGSSARYASIERRPSGFGTMMQVFAPDNYIGERIRMSAWVRTEDVADWAGLWMRVDGPVRGKHLAFDNMQGRPISGTSDWQHYEIVLDVDEQATNIAFGILVSGTGTVWLDEVTFEVVDASVPVTDMTAALRDEPVNMDFED